MADDFNRAAFDMLVELRGGLPISCDFCKRKFTRQRYPIPEEAGQWVCAECLDRWTQEDKQHGRQ